MMNLLAKWYPEDDPIIQEQCQVLITLVGNLLTEEAFEGFFIVCSRFVDEFGGHRTSELERIFCTDLSTGREALVASLEYMKSWVGGMERFKRDYPVEIIPPRPAFPQLKIIGVEHIVPTLYRILDSKRPVSDKDNRSMIEYISTHGRLPAVPLQRRPVRRTKPNFHWCSYEAWDNPQTTREALQILPKWSDCCLRATVATEAVNRSVYVAFNGDKYDPEDRRLRFYKYFYEPLAQDHPELPGGAVQVGVEGAPPVDMLEQYNEKQNRWKVCWKR